MLIINYPNIEVCILAQSEHSSYIRKQIKKYNVILYKFDEVPNDILELERVIRGRQSTYIYFNVEHDLDEDTLEDDLSILHSLEDIHDDKQVVQHSKSEILPALENFQSPDEYCKYEFYSNYRYQYHQVIDAYKGISMHVIDGVLMQSHDIMQKLKSDIERVEEYYNYYKREHEQKKYEKELDKRKIVNDILKILIVERPTNVVTKNSYYRYCLYEALELYALQFGRVWVQRVNQRKDIIAKHPMCTKHKCSLRGSCDCCSDPFCCGPTCDLCFHDPCPYAVDEGDVMYNAKVTVSLNIYYEKPKNRILKSFPR